MALASASSLHIAGIYQVVTTSSQSRDSARFLLIAGICQVNTIKRVQTASRHILLIAGIYWIVTTLDLYFFVVLFTIGYYLLIAGISKVVITEHTCKPADSRYLLSCCNSFALYLRHTYPADSRHLLGCYN